DFQLEDAQTVVAASSTERGSIRGGPKGTHGILVATLPEAGLYTLSVFGEFPGGQSWMLDGCRKSVLCPVQDATARWRVVLSGVLAAGPHSFAVTLGPEAVVHRLRLERKKDAVEDYTATLRRLGLDLGPAGPVTRAKADEARRFIERRRTLQSLVFCGDIVPQGTPGPTAPPPAPPGSHGPPPPAPPARGRAGRSRARIPPPRPSFLPRGR